MPLDVLLDPFAVMNAVGLVAFALVGASKGIRERFDLLGITIVGLTTAFAGGATRDILVDRTPLVLESPVEVGLGMIGVALAIALSLLFGSGESDADAGTTPHTHPLTLYADAVGLAAFTVAGSIVATEAGLSGFGVVAVATINACGGGALADLLLGRSPFILFEDFYASCSILGGTAYWVGTVLAWSPAVAAALCAGLVVSTRVVAIALDLGLPTAHGLVREWTTLSEE